MNFVIRKVTSGIIPARSARSAGVHWIHSRWGQTATLASLSSEGGRASCRLRGKSLFCRRFQPTCLAMVPPGTIISSPPSPAREQQVIPTTYCGPFGPIKPSRGHSFFPITVVTSFIANYASGTVQKVVAYCTLTPVPTSTLTPAPPRPWDAGRPLRVIVIPIRWPGITRPSFVIYAKRVRWTFVYTTSRPIWWNPIPSRGTWASITLPLTWGPYPMEFTITW